MGLFYSPTSLWSWRMPAGKQLDLQRSTLNKNLSATKVRQVKKLFGPASLIQSTIALLLIALCLLASQWQFHRGQGQSRQNSIISHNSTVDSVSLASLGHLNPIASQWRRVSLTGQFDLTHQELIRNRYFEGKYGFEVLSYSAPQTQVHIGLIAVGLPLELMQKHHQLSQKSNLIPSQSMLG